MRVALIHEWFVNYAGSERVVEQMLKCFPQADLFCVVDFLRPEERGFLMDKPTKTTFVQRLPMARHNHRKYLPLMPLAIEQHNLSGYDIVISSSHAVAKGVIVGPDQLHICMCYSPMRYAWDLQHQYLAESNLTRGLKGSLARWSLHKLRLWDTRTANGVDQFIAISNYIGRRIDKAYRRDSTVIYPPVDVTRFKLGIERKPVYFTASRMVPYKRMPMIVEAFQQLPDRELVVIGDGPDFERCRAVAGANVQLLGWQPTDVLLKWMQQAQAFIFAAEEDFGIAPLEAQACGTPVIAFARGAALETIRGYPGEGRTGVFFNEQTPQAIAESVREFEQVRHQIDSQDCRANAVRFSPERFRDEFSQFVLAQWAAFCQRSGRPIN